MKYNNMGVQYSALKIAEHVLITFYFISKSTRKPGWKTEIEKSEMKLKHLILFARIIF